MNTDGGSTPRAPVPGPAKFDRRLHEKMVAAGFGTLDRNSLEKLVHYSWTTLALTNPVECVLFRLVTVEKFTIDETANHLHIGEKTVRRGIQEAENRLISMIEFYREVECVAPKSADRLYGCFHSLLPESEALASFHVRLLDLFFHALAGLSGPVRNASARLAWGEREASRLSWPHCNQPVPSERTLIPGIINVLMAADSYIEASRICRCMVALANDKNLTKTWQELVEAIQPNAEAKWAVRAKMLLLGEARASICHAMLVVMARSSLDWAAICGNRFADLAGLSPDRRVESSYMRFLVD